MFRGLSYQTIYLYALFVFIGLLWMLYKHRGSSISMLIILLFFQGFFAFFVKDVINIYRVITLCWAVTFIFNPTCFSRMRGQIIMMLFFFISYIIFSIYGSLILNNDNVMTVLSQLSRYVIIMAVFLEIRRIGFENTSFFYSLNILFGQLLLLQLLYNIIKLFMLGSPYEGLVGTITGVSGGGVGTTIPLMGLCWLALNTNMELKNKKNVFFVIGLLFIGFMTGKRAVWLLFPILFLLLGLVVAKKKYPRQMLFILILTPVLFYFGLRLSPTLNPEREIWGSFDPEFAWNYAMEYSAGTKVDKSNRERLFSHQEIDDENIVSGQGRVGANKRMIELMFDPNTPMRLSGYGIGYVFAADYSQYTNAEYYMGANSRGSLTGIFMFFLSVGLIGVILFLSYYILMYFEVKYLRLRWLLMGVALFDFFFYNATIIRDPSLAVLMVFLIFFSRIQYNKKGEFIGRRLDVGLKNLKIL